MVAKQTKKSRQAKRAAARKTTKTPAAAEPGKPPMVKVELSIDEANGAVSAFNELPMKFGGPLIPAMSQIARALKAALTINPKG